MTVPFQKPNSDGEIIEVEKPLGLPTNVYVEYYKKLFNAKVGQGGTLDPLAEGKIVILIGNSTKQAQAFLEHTKVYEMTVLIGANSLSGDLEQPLTYDSQKDFTDKQIIEAVHSFEGESIQKVPIYSAAKQGGKSQYKIAQRNISKVEIKERPVTINILSQPLIERHAALEIASFIEQKVRQIENSFNEMGAKFQEVGSHMPGKFLSVKDKVLRNLAAEKQNLENMKDFQFALVSFSAKVSKGTYMRALAEDIGTKLETKAVAFSLRRTGV